MLTFENLDAHVVPINEFSLKWRFTDEKYDKLPLEDLEQLMPLDEVGAHYLWEYIASHSIHEHMPFKEGLFENVYDKQITLENEDEVRTWLFEINFQLTKQVYLSWDKENAMIVTWEMLVKYFDSFYYPGSDDLTIIDNTLEWTLLFAHFNTAFLGLKTNASLI